MGFFFEDKAADPAPTGAPERPKRGQGRKEKEFTSSGQRGCEACPLHSTWAQISTPRMKLGGSKRDPDVLLLGEAPSEADDRKGLHFQSPGGKMLRKLLPSRHLDRVAFQYTARCFPVGREATHAAQHACSVHLDRDVVDAQIDYIIGSGQLPLARFFPGASIGRVHGVPIPVEIEGRPVWYWPVLSPEYVESMGGERSPPFAILQADIKRFFAEHKRWGKPQVARLDPREVVVPQSREQAQALVSQMKGTLGFDIETNQNLRPYVHDAKIITAAFSDGERTIAFPIDHPGGSTTWGLDFMLDVLRRRRWAAHNALFELNWITYFAQRLGQSTEFAEFDDSQTYARLAYERETIQSLDDVSLVALGVAVKNITKVRAAVIMQYPLEEVLPYNGIDAQASALIVRRLKGKVHSGNYQRMLDAIRATSFMELAGLPTDQAAAAELDAEWGAKEEDARRAAHRLYEVREFEAVRQQPFNIASTDDVGEALVTYGKLDLPRGKGRPGSQKISYTTDDAALKAATKDNPNPLVDQVLAFREASKTRSTYIVPVQESQILYPDCQLHPQYTVMKTATGRLSSEGPNIQNFPKRRHKKLRSMIVPPKGYGLFAFDYAQLEARVIAMASQDRNLCAKIISKYDIHSYWRDYILERYPEYIERLKIKTNQTEEKKILKGGRDIIKTDFVFASFFGATTKSCSERTEIPLPIMTDVQGDFWREFKGVENWIKAQRRLFADEGLIRTLTGMARRGILWGNEPINTPVQGTGAHVVLDAMNACAELSRELKDPAFHPRINIHDDLTFFLPESEHQHEYIELIAETLVAVRYPWQTVPFAIEASTGPSWAELEEFAVFEGEYLKK